MLVDVHLLQLHPSRRGRAPSRPSAALLELTHRHGPLQPVLARALPERRFEILGNVEAWLAAQSCEHRQVTVEVLDGVDDEEALEILDGHRAADPIDEAHRYRRLIEIERAVRPVGAVTRVAEQCGVGRTRVSHALRLLTLPEALQEALRIGALTAGHARVLLTCTDPATQVELGHQAIRGRWSVRATEAAARAIKTKGAARTTGSPRGAPPAPPAPTRSPDILRLEDGIGAQLGSPVVIDETAGTLTIDYGGSLDVFEGLLERLFVTID